MFVPFIYRCLIECRDEYKYNVEAVELLIRNHLVNMQQYDLHLAQVHITDFSLKSFTILFSLFFNTYAVKFLYLCLIKIEVCFGFCG